MDIRLLKTNDVTENYVDWFSNNEVVKYSDNQYRCFSLEGQRSYVQTCLNDKNIELYGIFIEGNHIGNVVLDGIKSIHKKAEVTYVIGEKSYWGKGICQHALSVVIKKAKKQHKLNKLFAGIASNNIGSKKVLEKNNFILEGIRKKHLFYNNLFEDQLDYGLLL